VTEVTGAFGAKEIDDPGRRRIILRRPREQIVDDHEESLPILAETGARHPNVPAKVAVPWTRRDRPTASTDVHAAPLLSQ
jgi:hypothetical protein